MIRLLADIEVESGRTGSPFRAQLLNEDRDRIARLVEIAQGAESVGDLTKQALGLGWTDGDLRTFEFRAEVETLAAAMWDLIRQGETAANEKALDNAYGAMFKRRNDRLVGCLSRVDGVPD